MSDIKKVSVRVSFDMEIEVKENPFTDEDIKNGFDEQKKQIRDYIERFDIDNQYLSVSDLRIILLNTIFSLL